MTTWPGTCRAYVTYQPQPMTNPSNEFVSGLLGSRPLPVKIMTTDTEPSGPSWSSAIQHELPTKFLSMTIEEIINLKPIKPLPATIEGPI